MAIHDDIPRGVQDSVRHHIRQLDRFCIPVQDTLDTIRHLAKPLMIGMEDQLRGLDSLVEEIKTRWAYYEANGAWASSEDVAERLPKASASATNKSNVLKHPDSNP
jgi:hypothetical protein